jgi:glycosyltransferase involved in cell wall biosynthesis
MDGPSLSVVICTLDRAALLDGCLDAVAAACPEDGTVEVIVVDNGSTDHTAAVIAEHRGVERVVEPIRGLARARNAGLSAARGDVVAFLDDDARPEPGWATALLDARGRWPEAVALGGPVRLEWCEPPPRWLVPSLARWFSAVDHGPSPRLLRPDEHLVGANLAVARVRAIGIGGFAPELGRVGSSLASEEEVDLLRRLCAGGGVVGWVPDAAVRHVVPAARMTRRWLLRRALAQGRCDTIAARLRGDHAGRDVRLATRALARGWRRTLREVRAADVPSGAVVRDLLRRARRLGQSL